MLVKASKEAILITTMAMLREMPMQQVTIREIAKRAQVNIAAISYYFSTKEALFSEALDNIIQTSLAEWVSQHLDLNRPSEADLSRFLIMLHQACVDQPDFAKTRVYSSLTSQTLNGANLTIYTLLFTLLKNLYPSLSESPCRLRTSLLFSSLVALSCSPQEMSTFTGMTLTEQESLEQYVQQLIELIFH